MLTCDRWIQGLFEDYSMYSCYPYHIFLYMLPSNRISNYIDKKDSLPFPHRSSCWGTSRKPFKKSSKQIRLLTNKGGINPNINIRIALEMTFSFPWSQLGFHGSSTYAAQISGFWVRNTPKLKPWSAIDSLTETQAISQRSRHTILSHRVWIYQQLFFIHRHVMRIP